VGLLTRIATAPFALLGKLFGGGEEMNRIDFDAGSASLDAVAKSRMAGLLKSLQERPQLKLDVPISYSPELDAPALATKKLQDELLAVKARELAGKKHNDGSVDPGMLADPAEHYRLLVAQYRLELGKDAALPESAQALEVAQKKKDGSATFDAAITDLDAALAARIKILDTDLEKLGKLRARAVQDALLGAGEIDPSRVFLITQPPQPAVDKKVRLEMSLK
jgi:outer membrane protein OmpA-like peptidoglycan-associated protein